MTQNIASDSTDIQIQNAIQHFPHDTKQALSYRAYAPHLASLHYQAPIKNKANGKSVYVKPYENCSDAVSILFCDTDNGDKPLRAPFGLMNPPEGSNNMDRKTLALTIENDQLMNFLETLDQRNLHEAYGHKESWGLKDPKGGPLPDAIVNVFYKSLIDFPQETPDKAAPAIPFKPTFRLKVATAGDYQTNVFVKTGDVALTDDFGNAVLTPTGAQVFVPVMRKGTFDELTKTALKGCGIIPIGKCSGMWFAGGKFGMSFQATDILILPATPRPQASFMFNGHKAQLVNSDTPTTTAQPPQSPIVDENSMHIDDEVQTFAG